MGELVWEISVDSSIARIHQHASGAQRQPSRADVIRGVQHAQDEGLGHRRGGLTTKFHLACDGTGRPLSIVITAGQRHASTQLAAVLDGIRVPRPGGRGRPRRRRLLRQHSISHTIPKWRDQRARRAAKPGRPLTFDKQTCAPRNIVERCNNRLKQWRGLATRYGKRAVNYRAMLVLAARTRIDRPVVRTLIRQTDPSQSAASGVSTGRPSASRDN